MLLLGASSDEESEDDGDDEDEDEAKRRLRFRLRLRGAVGLVAGILCGGVVRLALRHLCPFSVSTCFDGDRLLGKLAQVRSLYL